MPGICDHKRTLAGRRCPAALTPLATSGRDQRLNVTVNASALLKVLQTFGW